MRRVMGGGAVRRLALITALASFACLLAAGPAAAAPSPWWHLTQRLIPSRIEPGGEATIVVQAINLGDAPTAGRFSFTDNLPPGVTLQEASYFAPNPEHGNIENEVDLGPSGEAAAAELCLTTSDSITCSSESHAFESELLEPVVEYGHIEMRLKVKVEAASVGPNELEVSGGGAPAAARKRPLPIGEGAIPFGLEDFSLAPEEEGGAIAPHAGSHPYQLTADVTFSRSDAATLKPPALPRNLHFKLPPGQLGNANVFPQCSATDFAAKVVGGINVCQPATQLGVSVVVISTVPGQETSAVVPIFNLAPAPGEPARFGMDILGNPVILDTSVRSGPGEDYGVTVDVSNITQVAGLLSATNVFWGTPGDPSHDESRGWGCIQRGFYHRTGGAPACSNSPQPKPPAFLTLPTDCVHPFNATFEGTSWPTQAAPQGFKAQPLEYSLADEAGNPVALTACNQVPFDPRIKAEPTSNAATSPTGLNFEINVEDAGLTNPEGVAQSQIKKAVVTLPQGFTTNPSVAEGLHACAQGQYESENFNSTPGTACPENSKVGDVEIESPLVSQKVLGSLYVAQQGQNPNSNLLTIYLVAKNAELGVLVKQALKVTPNPVTGQLTTEVDNVPELPFSRFHLSFRQGQRSPLVTPPTCGTYTVNADLYPWSNPSAPVHRESSFQITQGPEGLGCPSGGMAPFHPNLLAGSENPTAGAYSPFYTDITRRDFEQEITHFSIKLPPGEIGNLSGIPYCPDSAIAAAKAREHEGGGGEEETSPSCPAQSLIGHSNVGSGVGNVLAYAPGKLYLAGPYHRSNLSIVSITAAKVGPFDLGTVVVRFALRINPETAEVSVDGAKSDPIPHIVDGIPVHLRDIQAFVDRPNFTLNPTSCKKTSTASTVLGSGLNFASAADDQPVTVTSPFQVGSCASLGFKPKLALSLKGGTKRGDTPKFKAVVTYPVKGAYANIAAAQVTLPHSEFLDNAHIRTVCTRVQFNEGAGNGAACPSDSAYGFAKAVTPILDEPLEGPVYLRSSSHQLPDLVAALHNKQVNIDLDGHVEGVKGGIRNTFEAVPDAPVTKFTLEMQGGKKGLLENSTNLCLHPHHATAVFTGQNGKRAAYNPLLAVKCPKKHRKGHK